MLTIRRVFARIVLGPVKFDKMMKDLNFALKFNQFKPIGKKSPSQIEAELYKKYRKTS